MDRRFDIAVVGAPGPVAEALLELLRAREFPVAKLALLGSEEALGASVSADGEELELQSPDDFDFASVQLALFCGDEAVSAAHAPRAAAAGCVVIDLSPQFRCEADVPLVIPQINAQALAAFDRRGIVASPSCGTVQLLLALKPIIDAAGIERVNVVSCHPVSEAGLAAVEELGQQTAALLGFREVEPQVFPRQIAFNILPEVNGFDEGGATRAEAALQREIRWILDSEAISINATCLRVPVFYGLSQAVQLQTQRPLDVGAARALLEAAPGIAVLDEPRAGGYPTAVGEASGSELIHVGRLRQDPSHPRGLNLWIVADNVRRGAALNAVQIAEVLIRDYL